MPAIELEIVTFKEDPANDSAFAVLLEIRGPGNHDELLSVSFSEDFLMKYFKIPWHKNLVKEQRRLEKEERDRFIRWALVKTEDYIKNKKSGGKVMVTFEEDAAWAEKVERGLIPVKSRKKDARLYSLEP